MIKVKIREKKKKIVDIPKLLQRPQREKNSGELLKGKKKKDKKEKKKKGKKTKKKLKEKIRLFFRKRNKK